MRPRFIDEALECSQAPDPRLEATATVSALGMLLLGHPLGLSCRTLARPLQAHGAPPRGDRRCCLDRMREEAIGAPRATRPVRPNGQPLRTRSQTTMRTPGQTHRAPNPAARPDRGAWTNVRTCVTMRRVWRMRTGYVGERDLIPAREPSPRRNGPGRLRSPRLPRATLAAVDSARPHARTSRDVFFHWRLADFAANRGLRRRGARAREHAFGASVVRAAGATTIVVRPGQRLSVGQSPQLSRRRSGGS
jgi:hypothetical protein